MSVQIYITVCISVILVITLTSCVITNKVTKEYLSEKVKVDVTSEQMINAEGIIQKFHEEHDMPVGVSIAEIAEILGVEQGGVEPKLSDQGCLINSSNGDKKIVVFKPGLSETEKRFVFAHEVAHLLNGDSIPVSRPDSRHKSEIEQLADYTAAALLMPLELVYEYLQDNEYKSVSTRKRVAIVRRLCREYDVTEVIALRRIREVYELKKENVMRG